MAAPSPIATAFSAASFAVGQVYRLIHQGYSNVANTLRTKVNDIITYVDCGAGASTVKDYVDAVAQGIRDPKDACRAASTGNLVLSGTQTVDAVALVAGNRCLAKDQTAPAENGIWVVASGAWARATDFDATTEVTFGTYVPVVSGTANGNTAWLLTTADPITVGTTALTFQAWPKPANHAGTHSDASTDALTVANLAGNLTQARSHDSPDTDAGANALHHTLGTGAAQACGGADARLSDTRAPTAGTVGPLSLFTGTGIVRLVRCATTANHGLSGLAAIDGVTPVAGNRVLVKSQSTGAENGIYDAAAGAWARSADADATGEMMAGLFVRVSEGSTLANSLWVISTADPITVGTTAITFSRAVNTASMVTGAVTGSVIAEGGVGFTKNAVVNASYNACMMTLVHVDFAALAAGVADDVNIIVSPTVPYNYSIKDAWAQISTAIGGSTITVRNAAGGGGSALSDALSSAATGTVRNTAQTGPAAAAAGSTLYLRRSDRGVAGSVYLILCRTS